MKASSALSLSVAKTGDDITGEWTDADGENSYRVMRGTSPQAMTEIRQIRDRSATDPDAAAGLVCFFYSIDTPQNRAAYARSATQGVSLRPGGSHLLSRCRRSRRPAPRHRAATLPERTRYFFV